MNHQTIKQRCCIFLWISIAKTEPEIFSFPQEYEPQLKTTADYGCRTLFSFAQQTNKLDRSITTSATTKHARTHTHTYTYIHPIHPSITL
jgi:hypothetical protein